MIRRQFLSGLMLCLSVWSGFGAAANTFGDAAHFQRLLDYALIADAAYYDKSKIEKALAAQGYVLTASEQLPGYAVSYALATNHTTKQQLLAVRGTSNIENALVDIAFVLLPNEPTGIKLHQGFSKSADFIYDRIKPHLNQDYRINTTGHSLGGAVAVIAAMYLDAGGYNVGDVITFGQPKVTNISGSREYAHLDVTRVVTPKDMVPLVPPLDPMDLMDMNIYWHLGTELVLHADNTWSRLEGVDSMMRATDFLNEMLSEKNLKHHFMTEYINALSSKLVNARQIPYQNDFSFTDWFGQ
ncbi:MAG: lipase family protein [Gammaproteobacteria bacterium]|nr:lipase family protein [Gammaproteobacteria bacterium]